MRRFRFNLGTVVILVLLLGVGFAALRESNDTWDSSIFSISLGILSISILLAVYRIETRRAFWLGFAIFGWIYLALSLVPPIESRLITTKGLAYLHSKLPGSIPPGLVHLDFGNDGQMDLFVASNSQPIPLYINNGNGRFEDVTPAAGSKPWFSNIFVGSKGTTEHFVRVGHSLLALIAAFLGGLISRHLHAKDRSPVSGRVNPQA